MSPHYDRRQFLYLAGGSVLAGVASGCGTIIHPERRGQPTGRLDPAIVLLDGLGLLLFFIPGIIAFAVDFSTGAIYLPPDMLGQSGQRTDLKKIELPRDQLTQQNLEKIVSDHSGREVHLIKGSYHTAPLTDLAAFWPQTDNLIASYQSRPDSSVEFRCQSP